MQYLKALRGGNWKADLEGAVLIAASGERDVA